MKAKESVSTYPIRKKVHTYEDYLALPDDRKQYQILEGELVMTPAPFVIHQQIGLRLKLRFVQFVETHSLGYVFDAPCDVVLSKTNVLQPDILFISNQNIKVITEKNIQGAPDLVVEIISPSTAYYDLFDKKEIYQKFGVKEYWLVDPKKEWIEIHTLDKGSYQLHHRAAKKGSVQSKLLIGFAVDLKELFKKN